MNTEETAGDIPQPNELELLKMRARTLGIEFSNNIGVDTLRERIRSKLEGKSETPAVAEEANPLAGLISADMPLRQRMRLEQTRLVRLRITNMNPAKKDLPGEIYAVANEYLGTVKKFIPYGEATDEGYHVPWCLYQLLLEKKFQNIKTWKDRKTGQIRVETKWLKEFNLEVLPPLTPDELRDLATAQIAAGSIDRSAA